MASSVNRAHHGRGRNRLLPRRHNRTAVDRFANGCKGLSDDGVSVELHQTLIHGSAALARGPRRLWDDGPTPQKLIRTPTPALQHAGLVPGGRPSSVLARREGRHTACAPESPPEIFNYRNARRGLIQASGVQGIGVSVGFRACSPIRFPRPGRSPVVGPRSAASSPARSGVRSPRRCPAAASSRGPDTAAVSVTRRRSAGRRRPLACATGGRRPGPAGRPTPPGPAPCRVASPGGSATAWPGRWYGGTGRPPRRRPI